MAGDRPAVVGQERVEGIHADMEDGANLPHESTLAGK
jgi:hypothetical protein